jgi:hypothetical protein
MWHICGEELLPAENPQTKSSEKLPALRRAAASLALRDAQGTRKCNAGRVSMKRGGESVE